MKNLIYSISFLFVLAACGSDGQGNQSKAPKKVVKKVVKELTVPGTISIYRCSDFPVSKALSGLRSNSNPIFQKLY